MVLANRFGSLTIYKPPQRRIETMSYTRRYLIKTGLFLGTASIVPSHAQNTKGAQRSITTPVLEIAYEELGGSNSPAIILLHGFPYDIRSFDRVAEGLASNGFRVLVPYLRGYGPTRFLDPNATRMAEQVALAQDLLDFCSALQLTDIGVAGFDWGNRAACIASIIRPSLFRGFVSIGGYSVQDTTQTGRPAPAILESRLWYQWYFNTERGIQGLTENRHDIIRHLWETWSPSWTYTDEDYSRSASSFDNPDFVDVVIHSYRHRHANAPGEERFLDLEREMASRPPVPVRSIVLRAADSGFGPPSTNPAADQRNFSNLIDRQIVSGAGHDLPVQRPDSVIESMIRIMG